MPELCINRYNKRKRSKLKNQYWMVNIRLSETPFFSSVFTENVFASEDSDKIGSREIKHILILKLIRKFIQHEKQQLAITVENLN